MAGVVAALGRDGDLIFHATQAGPVKEVGRHNQARDAQRRALDLTRNRAERSLLERRLFR